MQTYVVAVSGGVDSVVLLDVLANPASSYQPAAATQLIVAHFDHGIRPDSADDRLFVQDLARKYGLSFVYDEGRLGPAASEALAREARYKFLRHTKEITHAAAIVTAHHEDDVLETAILNLLRGTGRRGLSSLRSTDEIWRPLLDTPKRHLIAYAHAHNLAWHEDSTNANTIYLRNYVRQRLLSRFDAAARGRLRSLIGAARLTNDELDELLAVQLCDQPVRGELDRRWFISLPHAVAREFMTAWLRQNGIVSFDKKTIERLVINGKTLPPGKRLDVDIAYEIVIKPKALALHPKER